MNGLVKVFFGLALLAALGFLGCPAMAPLGPEDLSWTAEADGAADSVTSTVINFTFSDAISGLTAEQIIVADDTGSVTAGELSGGGKDWSLGIAVAAAGDVKVRIDGSGIEAGEKTVAVHEAPPITYTAEADGSPAEETSRVINFAFSRAVGGLSAEEIIVVDGTGRAAPGTLAQTETGWSLAVDVAAAGTVKVRIAKKGIEAAEKTVRVYIQGENNTLITYTAAANGESGAAASTAIVFFFSDPVADLRAEQIALTGAGGAVAPGALSGGGTDWSLAIDVVTAGTVTARIDRDGIEAAEKPVAVYKEWETTTLAYTASANGSADTLTSTAITFVFSGTLTGLSAEHITLSNGTGAVSKGALTGSGASWSLAIGVVTAGTVNVSIAKDGVEGGEKTVTAHRKKISWTASADGEANVTTSTIIAFAFSEPVAGLNAEHISVANGTGAVTKGALAGSGTNWSLAIGVTAAGTVTVSIAKEGIDPAEKPVAAYKQGETQPLATVYTASVNDSAGVSTAIAFAFSEAVTGLSAEHITLADGTGAAIKGALAGSGKNWSLAIDVTAPGTVRVSIAKEGIEAGDKTLTVRRETITWTVSANGAEGAAASTALAFTFSRALTGLSAEQITIANEPGAVGKGSLAGSGTSWSVALAVGTAGPIRISIAKDGVEAAAQTVRVHKAAIVWTAKANGAANTETSTAIALVFSEAVAGLSAEHISVANGTGAVSKGALAGSGANWSLAVGVTTAGSVTVSIAKEGVDPAGKSVPVYKEGAAQSPTGFTASANGEENATTTTAIALTFDGPVTGLNASQITLADGTGSAAKGELSGSGANWHLPVTVTAAGTVTVSIAKEGIETAGKTVTVHKQAAAAAVTWTASANGSDAAASTAISFVFATAVTGLNASQITVADGTGGAVKGALTGYGTRWSLAITAAAPGTVTVSIAKEGVETAGKTVTVHKPVTWTAFTNGAPNTETSTFITFIFSEAVDGLTREHITLEDSANRVFPLMLSGGGTSWFLGITVVSAGEVKARIVKEGVETGEKTLAVYKQAASSGPEDPEGPAVLTGIEIGSRPDITIYSLNQAFNPQGLVVNAKHSDGGVEELAPSAYTLSSPDMASDGPKMITVSYRGFSAQFPIYVDSSDRVLQEAVLLGTPKTDYELGQEFSTTGLQVRMSYSNG